MTISAYNPTSYAPTNVTNGNQGATTPESERNAALQATGNTGSNPYSEAILHTQNWLQYMLPPQQPAAAKVSEPAPQPVATGTPGAPTIPPPTVQPEVIDQGGGPGDGERPPTGGTPVVPPPSAPQTPTPGTGGTRDGGRPVTPTSDDQIIADLVAKYGYKPEYAKSILDRSREWSKTPGYGWLSAHPEIIAMYEGDANKEGDFTEWVARSWEGLAAKGLVPTTPETAQQNDVARQLGYERWAQRLKTKNPAVTATHTRQYDEWYRWAVKTGVPTQDFWTWFGDPKNPNGPAYKPPTTAPGPIPGNDRPPNLPPQEPMPTAPETGGGVDNAYLNDLLKSLRDQGQVGRDAALRQFRHEAGMSGLNDMGAYNPALGTLIQNSIRDENSAIYEIMNAKDEGERNRALQKYLGEIGAKAQTDAAGMGAQASMYGADRGLEASKYSDDIRKLLGLAGLDVDREQNWWSNQNSMQQTILDYLRLIMGASPDGILGGNPVPGGDAS